MESGNEFRVARIVIADDHDLARSGLKSMLEDEPDLKVIGEARNGHEAVETCHRLRPDLVLMDVQMPKKNGLAATRDLREQFPNLTVVMMTIYESPRYLSEALRAGAAGYVLKGASKPEIVGAVRSALRGEKLPAPELAPRPGQPPGDAAEAPPKPPPDHITRREVEILALLAQGRTNREIARHLMLSPGTVKSHVQHVFTKLAVCDRTQAVVRAIELGLLPTPE